MENVHIGRFEARYHLRPSQMEARHRLQGILDQVLDDGLERALQRAGVPLSEEICIRGIHVPVRLRLSSPDQALVGDWSLALAEAIKRAIDGGGALQLVRYHSRIHGLIDFATGVARGDTTRAWAWRQMGFGRVADDASAAVAALVLRKALLADAASITLVIRSVAEMGCLARLAERFTPQDWTEFAASALRVAGASDSDVCPPSSPPPGGTNVTPPFREMIERLVARSALSRAVVVAPARLLQPERMLLAVAALVLLEAEPGVCLRGSADVRWLILLTARRLREVAGSSGGPTIEPARPTVVSPENPSESPVAREAWLREATSSDTARRGEESLAGAVSATKERDVSAAATRAGGGSAATRADASDAHTDEPGPKGNGMDSATPIVERPEPLPEAEAARLESVDRREAFTKTGGLLFLIRCIDDLGLPSEIATDHVLGRRSFRWVLHRLALTLAEMEDDDPAALAFAGLEPSARPPSLDDLPPTPDERDAFRTCVDRIAACLAERLEWEGAVDAVLLDYVCRKRARIIVDPGWIEVHLSLDEVATDIRRAALDLDLGYVPWLGTVLKFVYE